MTYNCCLLGVNVVQHSIVDFFKMLCNGSGFTSSLHVLLLIILTMHLCTLFSQAHQMFALALAVSCKSPALDPTPSSLGLSPKIAALYHLQHHTLATPRPPGVTEGRVGLRAAPRCSLAVEQPTSVGPGLASRRASWHVSDGGHLDPWVKTHLSNLHSTR